MPAADVAGDVDSPGFRLGIEADALEGDLDLDLPALLIDPCTDAPDAIPVIVDVGVVGDEGISLGAVGVDHQPVAVAAVEEGVKGYADRIVLGQR